jgi:hypothetical protein
VYVVWCVWCGVCGVVCVCGVCGVVCGVCGAVETLPSSWRFGPTLKKKYPYRPIPRRPTFPRYLHIVRTSLGSSTHVSVIAIGTDGMDARVRFSVFAKPETPVFRIQTTGGVGVVITGEAQCRLVEAAGTARARVADVSVQWNAAELMMKLLAADRTAV